MWGAKAKSKRVYERTPKVSEPGGFRNLGNMVGARKKRMVKVYMRRLEFLCLTISLSEENVSISNFHEVEPSESANCIHGFLNYLNYYVPRLGFCMVLLYL